MRAHAETLTDFLRQPKPILKELTKRDVVLRRRGDVPLRLSLESRATSSVSGAEIAANLLGDLVSLPQVPSSLSTILAKRFPWMKFLPDPQAFVDELVETLRACASVGNDAALDEVVSAWRSTAAIYADPKLAADLTRTLPGGRTKVRRP